MSTKARPLFDREIVVPAIFESLKKLNPVHMVKNPVMFVTEVGAAVTTLDLLFARRSETVFVLEISIWLWFTVIFANFAEAMAEGRGKAQAETLRRAAPRPAPSGATRTARSSGATPKRCARATCSSSRRAR